MLNKIKINNYKKLKQKIKNIFFLEKQNIYKVNYIFCNNKYILYINNYFLNKNYYTDTISFEYNYINKKNIYGDIFISVDQVYNNSIIWKQYFSIEMKRVIIHSILHLLGYNDNNKINKKIMINKENLYIKNFKNIKINKYEKKI